jgi:hypothetical protein
MKETAIGGLLGETGGSKVIRNGTSFVSNNPEYQLFH